MSISPSDLPPYLNLSPHLSAHKYFFVCTLTVAAWDTLVLSPRSWKLLRVEGWPVLKIIYYFLRFFMPVEFIIVGVAFFDSSWSRSMCQKFFLFEPICTAFLLAACSTVHVIRVHAIHDKSRSVLGVMGALLGVQIVITAISCGFFRSVPLEDGQGCIAGPKHNWVGIYWVSATLLYTTSFALAISRSMQSLQVKPLSPWKLMLRDGLNLYAAIWIVNMVNMLFWFIITPTGIDDSVKTIVTSMTAVITTTMTLRIILSVRGSLHSGGSFAGASVTASSNSNSASRGNVSRTHPSAYGPNVLQINSQSVAPTYTLDGIAQKAEHWIDAGDNKSSVHEGDTKEVVAPLDARADMQTPGLGVKITVDTEVAEYTPHTK
ncbi:hypothetical protein HETIRDRAFT_440061 [Heterobasidion irregulare TC 32-1]|uniref:Uncharacterized protein n=1 Tax=Heterobasidion irregulare (strain TC 32-1) TaxID=747525 RepID=W4K7I2_HETIT|nr:uncharacterized protein HETIRDRAFT_440061 [Heterobasidion irregulare TC 32-1]ETW81758.1 hypothetical protein HETIRDRAFT_440061 [Heterobasidion irregulare TC 32-1]